jgi:hypothetical protein
VSAEDNLNPQQFVSVKRIGRLISGDWGVPMHQVHVHPTQGDEGRLAVAKELAIPSGGRREYKMSDLTRDVAENGVKEPIEISKSYYSGTKVVEGHHRYVAARDAGLTKVPVFYTGSATPQDVVNAAGHYTPPR